MFVCVSSAGFDTEGLSSAVWPGGETEALTRLERHLERKVRESRLFKTKLVHLSFPELLLCEVSLSSVDFDFTVT